MDNRLSSIPNAFYDLIVFASSTFTFAIGVFFGVGLYQGDWYKSLGTANVFLIFAALIFLSYEYGRIAEAWSADLVQNPLKFIRNKTRFLNNPDFLADLSDIEEALGLSTLIETRKGGKWTVYFYAMQINPMLGTDLLKRYAWEKLSRNSAFTFCILTIISVISGILNSISFITIPFQGQWTFGSIGYSLISLTLMVFTYYEYYRRNCWNNDLLEKVLPVLYRAEDLTRKSRDMKLTIEIKNQ